MVWQDGRKRSLTPADQQPGQADGENEKQIVSTRAREREVDECRLCSQVQRITKHIEYYSVCTLVGIGTPPHPQASVPLPGAKWGGDAHSPAGEGVGESKF
jgi:hypothetical protein